MILCTHAVVGAAIGSLLPSHPAAALVLGFASHYALDAIPHWDYPIRSNSVNPMVGAPLNFDAALLRDVVVIGADGALGILLSLVLFIAAEKSTLLLGAGGAMLPDALQFLYAHFPREPLRTLARLHARCHAKQQISDNLLLGVGSQIALIGLVAGFANALSPGVLYG